MLLAEDVFLGLLFLNVFIFVFVGGRGYVVYYLWEIIFVDGVYFYWGLGDLKYNSIKILIFIEY